MNRTLAFFALACGAFGAEYTIVPDDTAQVRLEVDKTGLLRGKTHVFLFPKFRGDASHAENAAANSRVNLTLDAAGIQCQDTWLSVKDKIKVQQYAEQDMLAVSQYKNLTFRSSPVVAQGQNDFKVSGLLTIRDVAKPVEMIVKLKPGDGSSLSAEGTAMLKLTDLKVSGLIAGQEGQDELPALPLY